MPVYRTLIDRFVNILKEARMFCRFQAIEIMSLRLTFSSPTTHAVVDSLRSSTSNRYMVWRCCRTAAGCTALSKLGAPGSEGSRAPSANKSGVSSLSFLFETGCSTLSEVGCSSLVTSFCGFGFCQWPLVLSSAVLGSFSLTGFESCEHWIIIKVYNVSCIHTRRLFHRT